MPLAKIMAIWVHQSLQLLTPQFWKDVTPMHKVRYEEKEEKQNKCTISVESGQTIKMCITKKYLALWTLNEIPCIVHTVNAPVRSFSLGAPP